MTELFKYLLLILAVGTVAGLIFIVWTLRYIKMNHQQQWVELGSPSLFWNNSLRNNYLFLRFLFTRSYVKHSDPKLTWACNLLVLFYTGYAIYFVVLLILFPFATSIISIQ